MLVELIASSAKLQKIVLGDHLPKIKKTTGHKILNHMGVVGVVLLKNNLRGSNVLKNMSQQQIPKKLSNGPVTLTIVG